MLKNSFSESKVRGNMKSQKVFSSFIMNVRVCCLNYRFIFVPHVLIYQREADSLNRLPQRQIQLAEWVYLSKQWSKFYRGHSPRWPVGRLGKVSLRQKTSHMSPVKKTIEQYSNWAQTHTQRGSFQKTPLPVRERGTDWLKNWCQSGSQMQPGFLKEHKLAMFL